MEEHFEENSEEGLLLEQPLSCCPRIFEGNCHAIPHGFDTVTIALDGRVQADLDWKKERELARQAVEKGYAILWDMQLGLIEGLAKPLANQAQFLSLTLSLEHFRDTLWKEFKTETRGISIFRGSADFSHDFPWDHQQEHNLKAWLQETEGSHLVSLPVDQLQSHVEGQHRVRLFCRDVAVEYFALLATRLPDSLAAYLYLDASSFAGSLASEIQLLNPERFDRLNLALKGHHLPFDVLGWGSPTAQGYSGTCFCELPPMASVSIGVCIPPLTCIDLHCYQELEEGLKVLQKQALPFKLIAENQLTSQWDGLDYLLYNPAGLSAQGKRKLQGFCAAGGTVVSTGKLLGFPHEIGLEKMNELQSLSRIN